MSVDTLPSPAKARASFPRPLAIGLAGCVGFAGLTILVQIRALAGLDLAATLALRLVQSPGLYLWSASSGILLSAEFSLAYALIGAGLLWRARLGWWSLAPLTFLVLIPIELVLKETIDQPLVPPDLRQAVYYPLTSVHLAGSFPSGHALRSGFLGSFLAVLLWSRGSRPARWCAAGLGVVTIGLGLARVYPGQHWLSDVVAGLLLGGTAALLVARPVALRLRRPAVGKPD